MLGTCLEILFKLNFSSFLLIFFVGIHWMPLSIKNIHFSSVNSIYPLSSILWILKHFKLSKLFLYQLNFNPNFESCSVESLLSVPMHFIFRETRTGDRGRGSNASGVTQKRFIFSKGEVSTLLRVSMVSGQPEVFVGMHRCIPMYRLTLSRT